MTAAVTNTDPALRRFWHPVALFTIFLSTDFDASSAGPAKRFEEEILSEDRSALEGYREPVMVLDLVAEFHARADRMTVELRRVLAEIVARPSTASPRTEVRR